MYIRNRMNKVIKCWKEEARLREPILHDINWDTGEITIYTTRPGPLIGLAGKHVCKYEDKMKEVWPLFKHFLFKEVQDWVY